MNFQVYYLAQLIESLSSHFGKTIAPSINLYELRPEIAWLSPIFPTVFDTTSVGSIRYTGTPFDLQHYVMEPSSAITR